MGAIAALESHLGSDAYASWHSSLKGVSGCSAGCFTALSILLRLTMDQVQHSYPSMKNVMPQLTRDIQSLWTRLGASDVDIIIDIVIAILDHGGLSASVTMEHLYRFTRIECVFVCTSLTHKRRVYISHTSHPNVRVVDAIAASCCIPGVFRPVSIDGEYMVDGNLLESIPVPFPRSETLYMIVGEYNVEGKDETLNASSYLMSLLTIMTRYTQQLERLPPQRCIVLSHSSAVFDPLMSDDDSVNIRFQGFVQTVSFLTLGNTNALAHILRHCIETHIRLSIHTNITTSGVEGVPPLSEPLDGAPNVECVASLQR